MEGEDWDGDGGGVHNMTGGGDFKAIIRTAASFSDLSICFRLELRGHIYTEHFITDLCGIKPL